MSDTIMPAAENPTKFTAVAPFSTHAGMPRQQYERKGNMPADFRGFETPRISETNQELCRQYEGGNCSYGESCKYVHNMVERFAHNEPRRIGMGEMGQCAHRERLAKRCWWSFRGEVCPYGDKCRYAHKAEDNFERSRERSSEKVVLSVETKQVFTKGALQKDQKDVGRTKEAVWKTSPCSKWEKFGCCPFGSTCQFAHGRQELKTLGPMDHETEITLANTSDTLPREGTFSRSGAHGLEKHLKKSLIKWNDVEKISRVYADWLDLDLE